MSCPPGWSLFFLVAWGERTSLPLLVASAVQAPLLALHFRSGAPSLQMRSDRLLPPSPTIAQVYDTKHGNLCIRLGINNSTGYRRSLHQLYTEVGAFVSPREHSGTWFSREDLFPVTSMDALGSEPSSRKAGCDANRTQRPLPCFLSDIYRQDIPGKRKKPALLRLCGGKLITGASMIIEQTLLRHERDSFASRGNSHKHGRAPKCSRVFRLTPVLISFPNWRH